MVSEQLGDEQNLAVRVGDQDIRIAGIDPDLHLTAGSELQVSAAIDSLHFFADRATGPAVRLA
jgi:hypothetical protein